MFPAGLRTVARRVAAVNHQSIRTVVHGVTKPRNIVSFPEKCIHGSLIAIGILATPAYIAYNFKYYSGREDL